MSTDQKLSSPPEAKALFALKGLTLDYQRKPVLQNISLTITHGERIAIVGKSGSGKTTLLKYLREQQAQQCAWCPKLPGLVPTLSVYHNIFMGALGRHNSLFNLLNLFKPLKAPLKEITELAQQLKLDTHLHESVESLSGGQQQRVNIGRSLHQQRTLFIGDEPVSGLDSFQSEDLLQLISDRHHTLILALHDTEQALKFCDRIIGIKDQQLLFDSPSRELNPAQLTELYA
jgi:phosphonate transport system ATP-binding protein